MLVVIALTFHSILFLFSCQSLDQKSKSWQWLYRKYIKISSLNVSCSACGRILDIEDCQKITLFEAKMSVCNQWYTFFSSPCCSFPGISNCNVWMVYNRVQKQRTNNLSHIAWIDLLNGMFNYRNAWNQYRIRKY